MRGNVFGRYLSDLSRGDPVALAATGVFALFLLVVGVVWIKVVFNQRREERQRRDKLRKPYGTRREGQR